MNVLKIYYLTKSYHHGVFINLLGTITYNHTRNNFQYLIFFQAYIGCLITVLIVPN